VPFLAEYLGPDGFSHSRPGFFFREIQGSTNDQVAWGDNAVKILLIWARNEWATGLLDLESWKELFGFAFDEVNDQVLE
jgi:hypothetical protein